MRKKERRTEPQQGGRKREKERENELTQWAHADRLVRSQIDGENNTRFKI